MNLYYETLPNQLKEYFSILSNDFPDFLNEYINTKEMQKQKGISISCGTVYSKLFDITNYSSLDHSIGVALIVWNFTKDKKQTLAGLFHDIATPVFKHCIDFMNGDYMTQESTEELTTKIISDSKEIMQLLNRDNIKVEEVCDYHIYPIADNDRPRLSADRLEYTLADGLGATLNAWNLQEVREIYNDIVVTKNEEGIDELSFKTQSIAEKFVSGMSILSRDYRSNETHFSMQLLADIMKAMSNNNLITKYDMYNLSEKEVIEKIKNCKIGNIADCFKIWENATKINLSKEKPQGYYSVLLNTKVRYINPLVNNDSKFERIYNISEKAKIEIEKAKQYKMTEYAYLDFNLET